MRIERRFSLNFLRVNSCFTSAPKLGYSLGNYSIEVFFISKLLDVLNG